MKLLSLIRAEVLLLRVSTILIGLPSKDLVKASSGGGTKLIEALTIFDIMILPELSNK